MLLFIATSGGVVALIAFGLAVGRPAWATLKDQSNMVRLCGVSALTTPLYFVLNNAFAERYLYWSLAIGYVLVRGRATTPREPVSPLRASRERQRREASSARPKPVASPN